MIYLLIVPFGHAVEGGFIIVISLWKSEIRFYSSETVSAFFHLVPFVGPYVIIALHTYYKNIVEIWFKFYIE